MLEKLAKRFDVPQRAFGWCAIGSAVVIVVFILTINIVGAYRNEDVAKAAEPASEEPTSSIPSTHVAEMTEPVSEEPEKASQEWHFHNLDLQDDGDDANDYNFGPNPLPRIAAMAQDTVSSNANMAELAKKVTPEAVDADFRARLRQDPALGAADMAWADSIVGTRYLGVFYSEAEEKWDVAMNDAKDHWIEDADDYFSKLDSFEEYLDHATKVEIRKSSGLTDQMYMNPFTESGTPDIIVMETDDHDGWFLVYTFTIKETTKKEVMYRLDCGYQPTNVAKVMNITPQKKTTVVSGGGTTKTGGGAVITGGGSTITGGGTIQKKVPDEKKKEEPDPKPGKDDDKDPTPKPKPEPDPEPKPNPEPDPKPGPKPEPEPEPEPDPYDKNKDTGTQVQENDDKGPGESTNNGVGATESTKDQETNSNHQTQEQYKESIQENKDANETSREGGDSNEASYTPPSNDSGGGSSGSTTDNNGDSGNGGASIDTPTETNEGSSSNDDAGDSWDGPPD